MLNAVNVCTSGHEEVVASAWWCKFVAEHKAVLVLYLADKYWATIVVGVLCPGTGCCECGLLYQRVGGMQCRWLHTCYLSNGRGIMHTLRAFPPPSLFKTVIHAMF